jgi:hypothetical protein
MATSAVSGTVVEIEGAEIHCESGANRPPWRSIGAA